MPSAPSIARQQTTWRDAAIHNLPQRRQRADASRPETLAVMTLTETDRRWLVAIQRVLAQRPDGMTEAELRASFGVGAKSVSRHLRRLQFPFNGDAKRFIWRAHRPQDLAAAGVAAAA